MISNGGIVRLSDPQRRALRVLADRPNDFYRAASANVLDALARKGLVEIKYEWPSLYTMARINQAGLRVLDVDF